MKNKEDNPVPSIDKIKELIEEEFKELRIDIKSENEDDYQYGFNKACKMFKNSLLSKLNDLEQNGVETDKGKPKCIKCNINSIKKEDLCEACNPYPDW